MPGRKLGRYVSLLLLLGMSATDLDAQHFLEARGADTKYRYFDWNFVVTGPFMLDLFYVGVPGSNEFNLGGGYSLRYRSLTVTPLLYAVLGKEERQRGVKAAVLVSFEKDSWKVNAFGGHFAPLKGNVSQYQVLDTLDVTRAFGKRLEFGISGGLFHQQQAWNPQVGPMAKWNDECGFWAFSWRFGPGNEVRLGRFFKIGT